MRIKSLHLDGYGKFVARTIDFAPGLQIVFGPNEYGKSTIRAFILDMFYGQKSSESQRRYDLSNDLRRPWSAASRYGGRITYVLDAGTEYEVHRVFDRDNEMVQVFDRTNATDVTRKFQQSGNREVMFAVEQLAVGKAVFANIATIAHWSLSSLGDESAVRDIRERIVALADSASERGSAESAMELLKSRLTQIGRTSRATKQPLPAARTQLEALESEWTAAEQLRRELSDRESERLALLDEIASLEVQRQSVLTTLNGALKQDRARRLREAERVSDDLIAATKACFAHRRAESFPLESSNEVQRAANGVATARTQLKRSEQDLSEIEQQFNEALMRLGPAAGNGMTAAPILTASLEEELTERQTRLDRCHAQKAHMESDLESARRESADAASVLAGMPDFHLLGDDPAEWLSQLAATLRVADQAREREWDRLTALEAQAQDLRVLVREHESLFDGKPEIEQWLAGDAEGSAENAVARTRELADQAASLLAFRRSRIRSFAFGLVAGLLFGSGFALLAGVLENNALYLPAILLALGGCASGVAGTYALAMLSRDRELALSAADEAAAQEAAVARRSSVLALLRERAGANTNDDLRGRYEAARRDRGTLAQLESDLAHREKTARETDSELEAVVVKHRDLLAAVGEPVEDAAAMARAIGRVMARFRAAQEAARRKARADQQLERTSGELEKLRVDLKVIENEQAVQLVELREALRGAGFKDEGRHLSALDALKNYRQMVVETSKRKERADTIAERRTAVATQVEDARRTLATEESALQQHLSAAGVETMEDWEAMSREAAAYREARRQAQQLEERLAAILSGGDLDALRRQVDADGPLTEDETQALAQGSGGDSDNDEEALLKLRSEQDRLTERIDSARKREYALNLELTHAAAGSRPLNVIEEERAEAAGRVAALEFEVDAAAHALSVIEEVARDRHARLAPRMSALAGEYLRAITGGAYNELHVSRDLAISIRIPETARIDNTPQHVLSKGTIDQIYLAMRLALVRVFSENGESIPMLLDDPFANYDDIRLRRAFDVLTAIAKDHQVILFTCREDVLEAAMAVNAKQIEI